MDRGAVPDYEQFARNLPEQALQELDHVRPLECPFLLHHVELAFGGDGADRREVITAQVLVEHGSLANRGVGASFLQCPFLREGQRSSFQLLMTSSSRWFA